MQPFRTKEVAKYKDEFDPIFLLYVLLLYIISLLYQEDYQLARIVFVSGEINCLYTCG